jgi:hypothetical protein
MGSKLICKFGKILSFPANQIFHGFELVEASLQQMDGNVCHQQLCFMGVIHLLLSFLCRLETCA